MSDPFRVVITVDAPAVDRLAAAFDRLATVQGRVAAALERFAEALGPLEPPPLEPAELILVPRGTKLEFTTMSSIPNDKDAIQRLAAGDYDGPVRGAPVGGLDGVSVTPETPDGLAQRISGPADAIGTVDVEYSADKRHGGDTVETTITVTYEFVSPDAPNLQTADVEIVDKAA